LYTSGVGSICVRIGGVEFAHASSILAYAIISMARD
jgi:hypothetical protein